MKALVLFSGGVDSTTCLGMAIEKYGREQVTALSVFYGQKHKKEMEAAKQIAVYYQVEHLQLDLERIFQYSNCALLSHSDQDIPKEDYASKIADAEGKPVSTYVPFRNGLFLASAASIGLSKGCDVIYYGAHRDDAAGAAYPDCSKEFYQAMNQAVLEGSEGQIRLEAPFIEWTKAEVVRKGLEINVPFKMTWSCYLGGEKPCGICGTCRDRAAAFAENGILDI